VIAGSRPALNRVAWEAGFLTHNFCTSNSFTHNSGTQLVHTQAHTQLFHNFLTNNSFTHSCFTLIHHNVLAHFSHTHNSSTYNFVLIDPPPPPLSFLPSPSRLNFCSDYWKKLTCGVIRSFICFFDISRKSIPESLCNWGLFSPGTINFTGSLRLRGAKRYFHVEGFLQKSLISCSFD